LIKRGRKKGFKLLGVECAVLLDVLYHFGHSRTNEGIAVGEI
jgi:hypothetical protein